MRMAARRKTGRSHYALFFFWGELLSAPPVEAAGGANRAASAVEAGYPVITTEAAVLPAETTRAVEVVTARLRGPPRRGGIIELLQVVNLRSRRTGPELLPAIAGVLLPVALGPAVHITVAAREHIVGRACVDTQVVADVARIIDNEVVAHVREGGQWCTAWRTSCLEWRWADRDSS